jgi:hypothetical protein
MKQYQAAADAAMDVNPRRVMPVDRTADDARSGAQIGQRRGRADSALRRPAGKSDLDRSAGDRRRVGLEF